VDINPAQLALTRGKFYLATHRTPAERLQLLGHEAMAAEKRLTEWQSILNEIQLPDHIFGPVDQLAQIGPDYLGRYEVAFTQIQKKLKPWIDEFLTAEGDVAEKMISSGSPRGSHLEEVFAEVLSLANLVALFGEGATQNPQQPFHHHFLQQVREVTARRMVKDNPWLWQILAGQYPPDHPVDWLSSTGPWLVQPSYQQSAMLPALERTDTSSIDFLHLSNILDWLSPEEAMAVLTQAHRVLRPGGQLIIRQLNSSLVIPDLFPALHWHSEQGKTWQRQDRSFFYPQLHLASR
jgi:S-adenosylmethionine-diacylglycerol 3-amino-3-carboxypropyl transferase